MAYYYKVDESVEDDVCDSEGIQMFSGNAPDDQTTPYDFSRHVLIELLDNVTPKARLWEELGLHRNGRVSHKRLLPDPHRVNCRRAIVVCRNSDEAYALAHRLNQTKVATRCICAAVVRELLSDISLFEKQVIRYGDKRSQHQLVYVTDLRKSREPAELARYLREKFSPFGKILNIFVSQDENGRTHPEGVIRFSRLSEAFAAELAYDQCAVAMERLSVTTHHNILLSQCDLRARLREARLGHPNDSLLSREDSDHDEGGSPTKDDSSLSASVSKRPSAANGIAEQSRDDLQPSGSGQRDTAVDSSELASALNNSCESNLMSCLKGMTAGSEEEEEEEGGSATGFDNDDNVSLPSTLPGVEAILRQADVQPEESTTRDRVSSRIMGWLTDVETNDVAKHNTEVAVHEGATSEAESNGCSFVTCETDVRSPSKERSFLPDSVENTTMRVTELSDVDESPSSVSRKGPSFSTPTKRKHSSSSRTQKLSLKSQKTDSSSFDAAGDTTLKLPSGFTTRRCTVVLNTVPELDEMAKNLHASRQTLNVSDDAPDPSSKRKRHFLPSDFSDAESAVLSVRSHPVRRNAKQTREDGGSTYSEPLPATVVTAHKKNHFLGRSEGDSPLRAWLKRELLSSANNLMSHCKESSKSIICATANKDVLISVGCSHMTCTACYPDSTKLLLGCF